MKKRGLGVSPITNKIYYGTKDTEKHAWVGRKTDVTDDAIDSVFTWFVGNMEGNEEYIISYQDSEYELVMRRKEVQKWQKDIYLRQRELTTESGYKVILYGQMIANVIIRQL